MSSSAARPRPSRAGAGRLAGALALASLLASGVPAAAQETASWKAADPGAARLAVQREAEEMERLRADPSAAQAVREDAARRLEVLRHRLAHGDFQPGDHVVMVVEGEPQLSDTFAVRPGPSVDIPPLGTVALAGVLRPELDRLLHERMATRLIDPRIRTTVLVRLSIEGRVTNPGFYLVPSDAYLPDALMAAGGLTPEAEVGRVRVERGGSEIWSAEGETESGLFSTPLESLGLRTGDTVVAPGGGGFSGRLFLEIFLGVATVASLILGR